MLMRFDPYREMDRLAQLLTQQTGPAHQAAMPMDAYRDGYRFIIHFDLPGVDPTSIDLPLRRTCSPCGPNGPGSRRRDKKSSSPSAPRAPSPVSC